MAVTQIDEVEPRAQNALTASPVYALREIRVERHGKTLRLSGHVSSFYHKQLAQEVVRAVAEGFEVVNTVAVG